MCASSLRNAASCRRFGYGVSAGQGKLEGEDLRVLGPCANVCAKAFALACVRAAVYMHTHIHTYIHIPTHTHTPMHTTACRAVVQVRAILCMSARSSAGPCTACAGSRFHALGRPVGDCARRGLCPRRQPGSRPAPRRWRHAAEKDRVAWPMLTCVGL